MKIKLIILLLVGVSIVILSGIIPYLFTFRGTHLSTANEDWGQFGSYLMGIAAMLNVGVFIVITTLVHQYSMKNNERERQLNHEKELFIRFLTVYEHLIYDIQKLRIKIRNLTYNASKDSKLPNIEELTGCIEEIYATMRSMSVLSNTYIISENNGSNITTEINNYLESHPRQLLAALADNNININNIDIANEEVVIVLRKIEEIVRNYIRRRLGETA